MGPTYPKPPRSDLVEVLHGVEVADPFRPLENADDPSTRAWVEKENELTSAHLSAIAARPGIRARVAELWDHPKRGVPFERGGHWFQFRNAGLQAQSVLHVADAPGEEGRVLIDPNALSQDGTVALTRLGVSADGTKVAWATSRAGSDWMTWRVRHVDGGGDAADVLEWSRYSEAAWDGDGFYYISFDPPAPGEELTASVSTPRVAYHRMGTVQSSDRIEWEAADQRDWMPQVATTDDGRFLVVTVTRGTGTETLVMVRDLTDPSSVLTALNDDFRASDEVIDHSGDGGFYIRTDRDAGRGRVVRARVGLEPPRWEEVVPESDDTLLAAHLYGGQLVCHYLHDAQSVLRVFTADGTPTGTVDLPGPASVGEISGRAGSPVVHIQLMSYVQSGAIWQHDLAGGATRLVTPSAAPLEPSEYVTEQVFVTSPDGTDVPVFLTHRVGIGPNGQVPVLLYGYGGFNIALTPTFSVTFASWLERGGLLAVANLRGGGEYGRAWHEAGRLADKQNVFDDFAACARWLVSSGWSRPSGIAIMGGSNGGLLVGATITQHPELVGAALAEVGVMDMLRFHLFTIGRAWKADYGDPDDPEQFAWLRAYSPLHHIRDGVCYPATLVMTGDHDDRVVPAHSLKFAARLQEAQSCEHPVLLRVTASGGHGAGKPTSMLIDEAADRLAFLADALGHGGRP